MAGPSLLIPRSLALLSLIDLPPTFKPGFCWYYFPPVCPLSRTQLPFEHWEPPLSQKWIVWELNTPATSQLRVAVFLDFIGSGLTRERSF